MISAYRLIPIEIDLLQKKRVKNFINLTEIYFQKKYNIYFASHHIPKQSVYINSTFDNQQYFLTYCLTSCLFLFYF